MPASACSLFIFSVPSGTDKKKHKVSRPSTLPAGIKAVTVLVRRNKNNLPTAKPLPFPAKALNTASHYGHKTGTALIAVRGFHAPGYVAVAVLGVVNLLLKRSRLHRKRTQAAAQAQAANYRDPAAAARYNEEIIELMKRMAEIYEMNLEALNVEDRKRLKKLRKEARGIRRSLSDKMAMEVMPVVRELPDKEADRGKRYVQMVEYATSVFESLSNITTASHAYIDNNHEGLDLERIELLRGMNSRVSSLYPRFREMMESNDYTGLDECLAGMDALDEEFAEAVKQQIILRPEDASDMRRALLYLNLLNETRAMIRKVLLLAKIQRKFVLGW